MKRLFVFIVTLTAAMLCAFAQSSEKVLYYGVDFSDVKVISASETEADFAGAFEGINNLMVDEADKYDFSRAIGMPVVPCLEYMIRQTRLNDYSDMKVYNLIENDIDPEEKVKSYELKETSGLGLVVIAEVLNKPTTMATYKLVLFDIETREIKECREFTTEARGFGLRNYWAHTVYKITRIRNVFAGNKD